MNVFKKPILNEAVFIELAKEVPEALLCIINSQLSPGLRARAVEATNHSQYSFRLVYNLMCTLEKDPDPVVKEACIYALERHIAVPGVSETFARIAQSPLTTRGVRQAAIEALEEV